MSTPFVNDKIMTSNPFIDLLLYNLKILAYNCIIKDDKAASENETVDSLKNSGIYIACLENHAMFEMFADTKIPKEFLQKVGMSEAQINLYITQNYDIYYIPDDVRDKLLKLLSPWYIENYEELNEYYRMITGKPPVGDIGIPMRDYEYLMNEEDMIYEGDFVHEIGLDACKMLEATGILDIMKADYPDAKYLDYVTKDISIYDARKKLDFQILYYPEEADTSVREEFLVKYAENRRYVNGVVYSSAMEFESEYYHSFITIYILITTIVDMLTEVQSHIVKKDILDRRCVQYIFSIFGIPYYREIPYKYQERMCKNVWSLVKYKSCTTEMLNLINLFGFDSIHIFKYYILKCRRTNAWGEYEYNETTKLVSRLNEIVAHETLEESTSSASKPLPIPPNLDWYEKATQSTERMLYYNIDGLIEYDDEESTNIATISAVNNEYNDDENNANYILNASTRSNTIRYIKYPFDYFREKGNVVFVKLDGYVLKENIDYRIFNYNQIEFLNGIDANKHTITYEFYYDKESIDRPFQVDTAHSLKMEIKQIKVNTDKNNHSFDLNPLPFANYFYDENQLIVSVSSVWLPPALYSIDKNTNIITIDDSVDVTGRVVTFIFLYSRSMKSKFEKHNVVATESGAGQNRFAIPEPFPHYCINENQFFLTIGSTYIHPSRYTITPSKEQGKSVLVFNDGTKILKGRSVTFNFIYSLNAIVNIIELKRKTITVTATKFYQYEFDVKFPVTNYVDCRYKVYIHLLDWWVPEEKYTITNDKVIFLDQSMALQPGDTMDIVLVYVDKDRTKTEGSNIIVATDWVEAEQDKQSTYKIEFPVDHYFTKENKLIVDVEGILLEANKDYTVNEDAKTVTLKTYDYKPMKGQRVNYTFIYNQDAEYIVTFTHQQINVTNMKQDTFTLEFPFFPYTQTGHGYIVIVGTTIVTPDRIEVVDQFNIKISKLNLTQQPRYITILYIYNNYYLTNGQEKLIVEWKNQSINGVDPYITVPVPFEEYIENDWPYFVTYGNRQYLDPSKYDIYDSYFYTNPGNDLNNKKYGSSITFTFIYLIRKPWVYEIKEEDYTKDMDLVFCKIPIEDLYSSQYLKDQSNYKSYDAMTYTDGWWDGLNYKQNYHEKLINKIYQEKFNYARSKYYTLMQIMDLGEYSTNISYFYSMLYDDVFLEEELNILIPNLSPYHKFNIAHLFIYMTSLTYLFHGLEDFVIDRPSKIYFVKGFNFKSTLKSLKEYLRVRHREQKAFPIWNMIIPTTQIKDMEEFMNIYWTDLDVRKTIVQEMISANDAEEYLVWEHIYDTLMRWQLTLKYFTLDNGQPAKTYKEFLKDKDIILYNSIMELESITDYETRQDSIVEIVDSIVYILSEWIDAEATHVFERFPGQSPEDAMRYLLLMLNFFKSYKIVFITRGQQLEIGKNGPDEDSVMYGYDVAYTKETSNIIRYFPVVEDVTSTENMVLSDKGNTDEWIRDDFVITQHGTTTKSINEIQPMTLVSETPVRVKNIERKVYEGSLITEFNGMMIFESTPLFEDLITGGLNVESHNVEKEIDCNVELINSKIKLPPLISGKLQIKYQRLRVEIDGYLEVIK